MRLLEYTSGSEPMASHTATLVAAQVGGGGFVLPYRTPLTGFKTALTEEPACWRLRMRAEFMVVC